MAAYRDHWILGQVLWFYNRRKKRREGVLCRYGESGNIHAETWFFVDKTEDGGYVELSWTPKEGDVVLFNENRHRVKEIRASGSGFDTDELISIIRDNPVTKNLRSLAMLETLEKYSVDSKYIEMCKNVAIADVFKTYRDLEKKRAIINWVIRKHEDPELKNAELFESISDNERAAIIEEGLIPKEECYSNNLYWPYNFYWPDVRKTGLLVTYSPQDIYRDNDTMKLKDLSSEYRRQLLCDHIIKIIKNADKYVQENGPENRADYTRPSENEYSNLGLDADYLRRYGAAYAREYIQIYKALLKNYQGKVMGVYSFGCGSLLDAWALLYAKALLDIKGAATPEEFRYLGMDIEKWPIMIFDGNPEWISEEDRNPVARLSEDVLSSHMLSTGPVFVGGPYDSAGDIAEFIPSYDSLVYNVFIFPKILNELDDSIIKKMLENIKKKTFKRSEIYLCFSHSYSKLKTGRDVADKIVKAMANQLDPDGKDIVDVIGVAKNEKEDDFWDQFVEVEKDKGADDLPVYTFRDNVDFANMDDEHWHISYMNSSNKEQNDRKVMRYPWNINIPADDPDLTKNYKAFRNIGEYDEAMAFSTEHNYDLTVNNIIQIIKIGK